jgi:hypothetical protein
MLKFILFLSALMEAVSGACNFTLPPSSEGLRSARDHLEGLLSLTKNHLSQDYVICLLPGIHSVASTPHTLTSAHSVTSGPGRVIWRGLGQGVSISGGAQVTGWTPTTLGGGAVYVAAVPAAVAPTTVIRQLWVASQRTSRTVLNNPAALLHGMSLWRGSDTIGYITGAAVPPSWLNNNTASIEFTYPIVLHNWVSPRCTVASIEVTPPSPPGPISGPIPDTSVVSNSGILPGGNVSGQVLYAGEFATALACSNACVASSACTSYTWHDSTVGGGYALQCYFRLDGVWEPEAGWAGHFSGNKGGSGEGSANITLVAPCGGFVAAQGLAAPVTIEAAPIFPLPQGVFYHDLQAHLLYYALGPSQTPQDLESSAWVAAQDVLVEQVNVSGHVYDSLNFEYGSWGQVNSADGFVDQQAAVFGCTPGGPTPFCPPAASALAPVAARPAAAAAAAAGAGAGGGALGAGGPPMSNAEPRGNVRVSGGSGNTFQGCNFSHLGAAYALSFMESTHYSTVFNCTFTDLSGGFLKLGSVAVGAAGSQDPSDWDSYASITHNVASDMAMEYDGAVGYFGGFLYSAVVEHNSVSDAGYSGFSQGWGWGTVFPVGVGNNSISYNRISNVMRLLRDGGGIYVNGAEHQGESVMAHNYVTGDQNEFAVYYLDNVRKQVAHTALYPPPPPPPYHYSRLIPHPHIFSQCFSGGILVECARQCLRQIHTILGIFHDRGCQSSSQEQPHGAALVQQVHCAPSQQPVPPVQLHRRRDHHLCRD